jgi:hypothetical protein
VDRAQLDDRVDGYTGVGQAVAEGPAFVPERIQARQDEQSARQAAQVGT